MLVSSFSTNSIILSCKRSREIESSSISIFPSLKLPINKPTSVSILSDPRFFISSRAASSQLELAVLKMVVPTAEPSEDIVEVSADGAVSALIDFVETYDLSAPLECKKDLPEEFASTFIAKAAESCDPLLQYLGSELISKVDEPKLYTGQYL